MEKNDLHETLNTSIINYQCKFRMLVRLQKPSDNYQYLSYVEQNIHSKHLVEYSNDTRQKYRTILVTTVTS